MRREATRAHIRGVRGDSAPCLLQYACLKLSKPGLAVLPWHSRRTSLCQCQLQLGAAPAGNARLSLAHGNACSPLSVLHCFHPSFLCLDVFHYLFIFPFFFHFFFASFFLDLSLLSASLYLLVCLLQVSMCIYRHFCWFRLSAHVYPEVLD